MNMNKHQFLKRIKELRKQKNLTQAQLAEEAELSLKTVSNFENGEFMGKKTMDKIAAALGVKIKRYYLESFTISN